MRKKRQTEHGAGCSARFKWLKDDERLRIYANIFRCQLTFIKTIICRFFQNVILFVIIVNINDTRA